ncbi:hypothetical protein RZO50_02015 [Microbacterium sp. SSW1-59]|uniref:hypothetical protein n=1 Tax=Microbacterium xanthum TaxID=3079794 RepID=UPI002AD5A09E|nr:hypothetical protein [Microbacterium sp. SSW1-59]MDZ8200273.1 hypothetical protein [Microbacterium sp. SSW1-59]
MSSKAERHAQLGTLVRANGVELGQDDESLRMLNLWFNDNVGVSDQDPERLRNLWYAVVNDIALWLGDVIISKAPALHWTMFTKSKRDVSYQRHVLMGFKNVQNPNYNVDPDRVIATLGHRAAKGLPVSGEDFVNLVCAALRAA